MFLIPLCCFVIASVLRKCCPQLKTKNALRSDLIITGVEYAVLLVLFLILHRFAAESGGKLPIIVTAFCCALPFACSLLQCTPKTTKIVPFLERVTILAAVLMLTEIFVMNLKSFTPEQRSAVISPEDIICTGEAEIEDRVLKITGGAQLDLENVPDDMGALILYMSQERTKDTLPFKVGLFMKDDNFFCFN